MPHRLLVLFWIALTLAALNPPVARAQTSCRHAGVPAGDAATEQRLVELVNAERVAAGLLPLRLADDLSDAARAHAADMVRDQYFSHQSQDRTSTGLTVTCDWDERLRAYYDGDATGETIALGHTTPEAAVRGWMASPSHRAIMLGGEFREVGAGVAAAPAYGTAWVLDFGRRDDVFPLVIAGEAATTTSRSVPITIYNDDPGWRELRLRVGRAAWGPWQPFRPTLTLDLGPARGSLTVTAQLRRPGRTAVASDTIIVR